MILSLICFFSCDYAPEMYSSAILESCREFGVEPALVFAIAEVESHFCPSAVSEAGAIGIMQVMPSTGEWIAAMLQVEDFDAEALFDPDLNLRIGVKYLSYLQGIFVEEWQVIAAYNAGEGVVGRWIRAGITEENIPYEETASYLLKVKKRIPYYRRKKFASFD